MDTPLISIITVVYNGKNVLEKTIQSVLNQTYQSIEYIIIDGGSTDGTVEMIKRLTPQPSLQLERGSKRVVRWISEKDNGIYDAMNKGMKMAMGEYLLFLNAGDELYEKDTMKNIFYNSSNADIYYGETAMINIDGKILGTRSELTTRKLPQNLTWKNISEGMVVCHQSFIVKKSIVLLYDLQFRYAADIDWVIVCLKNAKIVVNTNLIISKFLLGGFSKKNQFASWADRFKVMQKHFGFFNTFINHVLIIFRAIFFEAKN